MKTIDCYLDFVSPYAYLAFEQLPQALLGLSYEVRYQPVLLGALFQRHGHQGPPAIAPKHAWIKRHTRWLAGELGVPLQWPAAHPFNPLPLLRLAWACARQGTPNRWVCEQLFHHVWRGQGAAADDAARLAALTAALNPAQDPGSDAAKAQLRAATDAALAAGVFGAPSFIVDGRLFWGLEALPMLRAHLLGDEGLDALWPAPDKG